MKRYTVSIGDETTRLLLPEQVDDPVVYQGKRPLTTEDIITRAVEKIYGPTCFWWADSGLGIYYGQVMQPVPDKLGGGNSAVTCRVRVDVAEGWEARR